MKWASNVTGIALGSYRSIIGYAAEQAFIARAEKAGFNLFFKVWRDLEYDAVLDAKGILYRVEVKSTSGRRIDFTRGGRAGIQINRDVNKSRLINKQDCDFIVGVDTNDFTCYIVPVEYVEILSRKNLGFPCLTPFKEKWDIFLGGRLHDNQNFKIQYIKDGFIDVPDNELDIYLASLEAFPLPNPYKPKGTQNLTITDPRKIKVAKVWEKIGS